MADANAIAQAIQQALQQALQGNQQATQGIVNQLQPQQQQQQVGFARAPALANQGLIDCLTQEGSAIFTAASKELGTTFSVDEPNVSALLAEIMARAQTHGWNAILTVPVNGANINLLTGCGRMAIANAQDHADTCTNANQQSAQNDCQLLCCLKASVDERTTTKMEQEAAQCTRNRANPGGATNQSGICCLKVLFDKAQAGARAVASTIRQELAELSTCLVDMAKHNIVVFNDHIKDRIAELKACGEQSNDLLLSLLKAHDSCTDQDFRSCIQQQKEQCDEGEINLTPDQLMPKAEMNCKNKVSSNKWNKPMMEQEEIIALRAQVEQLQKPKKKQDKEETTKPRKKLEKDQHGRPIFTGNMKWRNTPPKGGEPITKTANGKEWKHCAVHGCWRSHT